MTSSIFWTVTQSECRQLLPTCRDKYQLTFKVQGVKRIGRIRRKNGYVLVGAGVGGNWFSENVNEPIMLDHGEKRK
jgi:hypothetical protein